VLTVITPTGGRPEALAILGHWIRLQTYARRVQWVVIDDCEPASDIPEVPSNWKVDVIRPRPFWQIGQNTQHRNMLAGLEAANSDRILILEDDDAYTADYVEVMAGKLERYEMVGEAPAIYYHVGQRAWRSMGNTEHASLCSTGFARDGIKTLRHMCMAGHKMIDHRGWIAHTGRKKLLNSRLSIGIKGLPGRPGIGVGHRLSNGRPDRDLSALHGFLGESAEIYRKYGR
jgi:hypothetical protein